jgi:hypothetical protein
MTEHSDVGRRLHDLGVAVVRTVTAPPPAAVRARAMRWHISVRLSTIRLVIGLVAAGAVVAVVVGMTTVVRDHLAPAPPIGWPSSPPPFSPSPRPTLPVPARPTIAATDPIESVDWEGPGRVTLIVPKHPESGVACPSGQVRLSNGRGGVSYPIIQYSGPGGVAYGDLTGDGRPEAALHVECLGEGGSGDGQGQLLVVTRESDGTLRGLAWVGPRGALYPAFWIADGTLYAEARPWHLPFEYGIGDVLAYRLQGGRFVTVDSGFRGIQAFPDRDHAAADADLAPVAGLLDCPVARLSLPPRDPRMPDDPPPTAVSVGGYIYDIASPEQPDGLPHWVDLNGDGNWYLLVSLTCRRDGMTDTPPLAQGVLVLELDGDNLRAIDFVAVDPPDTLGGWTFDSGQLTIASVHPDGLNVDRSPWTWNGQYFQR